MKIKPILFNTEMVKAILEGWKTQTRRVMKVQPPNEHQAAACMISDSTNIKHIGKYVWGDCHSVEDIYFSCPFGAPGDQLWVRETFSICQHPALADEVYYKADGDEPAGEWKPSIFMPRKLSRITLEITNIRVERVQDISPEDAEAEGIKLIEFNCYENYMSHKDWVYNGRNQKGLGMLQDAVGSFASLWDSINKNRGFGWDTNPYVWVVEFEKRKIDK